MTPQHKEFFVGQSKFMTTEYIIGHHSEMVDQIRQSVKKFGIYIYDDPSFEGSSDCAYVVSDQKLTKREVKKVCKEMWK